MTRRIPFQIRIAPRSFGSPGDVQTFIDFSQAKSNNTRRNIQFLSDVLVRFPGRHQGKYPKIVFRAAILGSFLRGLISIPKPRDHQSPDSIEPPVDECNEADGVEERFCGFIVAGSDAP